MARKVLLFH